MSPFISIIVPIYNTAKYLEKCIDSLMSQTYTNFEIILVDDGSTDNCSEICDNYVTKHDFIKKVKTNNGGAAKARNEGLAIAKGEYIIFVDSDDWVDDAFLSTFIDIAKYYKFRPDILVIQGMTKHYKKIECENYLGYDDKSFSIPDDIDKMFNLNPDYLQGHTCNKFFHKSLIGNLRFNPEQTYGEDYSFFVSYLFKVATVITTSTSHYNYVIRNNSVTFTNRTFANELYLLETYMSFFHFLKSRSEGIIYQKKLKEICGDIIDITIFGYIYKFYDREQRIAILRHITNLLVIYKLNPIIKGRLKKIDMLMLSLHWIYILDMFKTLRIKFHQILS